MEEELRKEIERLKRRIDKLESGSNKSMLNCHTQGKNNLLRYINEYHYQGMKTGEYIRNIITKCEPYSYEEIIAGEF